MLSGRSTMMYKTNIALLISLLCCAAIVETNAPAIGRTAPEFSAIDSQGHTRQLSDFHGKVVVLVCSFSDYRTKC